MELANETQNTKKQNVIKLLFMTVFLFFLPEFVNDDMIFERILELDYIDKYLRDKFKYSII